MSRVAQFADSVQRLFNRGCRFRQVALLACFAAMAGIAVPARAEDEILKLVPEQVLGFVVVHDAKTADAKLQQLGKLMNLPIPSLLARLQGPDGIRKGFDKSRPLALLVLPPKDDKGIPSVIGLIPVSDYAKFLEQFKAEDTKDGVTEIQIFGYHFVVRSVGAYAAITGQAFPEALENVKLADEVPAALAPWRTWLAEKDAVAIITAPGIRLLSAKVQQGIAAIKPILALPQAGPQGKQAAAGLDMYVTLFQAVEKEVASGGIGVELDAQGVLRLSKRASLVSGGDWAAFVAGAKPAKENVLAGLPDGPFAFAGGGPLAEDATRKMMGFSFGMIKNMREMYGLSEEQAEMFAELGKEKFPAIRGFSIEFGAGPSGVPIFSRTLGIMRIDNREKFLAEYEKFVVRYNQVAEKIDSSMFRPMQLEKTEVDGNPAMKLTMSVPKMPNMPPESAKMMENMYGPGGKITAWVVPCSDNRVVVSYMDKEHVRQAIAAIKEGKPGLADDGDVAKVAALLPTGAVWSMYLSPKGMFDFVRQTVAAAAPPGNGLKIPEFPATPPVAMAVTTGTDEVEVQLIVPAEVTKAVGELIKSGRSPNSRPKVEDGDGPSSAPLR